MSFALALFERLQAGIHQGLVWCAASSALAYDGEHAYDVRVTLDHLLGFLADVTRVSERGALRCLHDENQVTLVIFRKERARDALVDKVGRGEKPDEHHKRDNTQAEQSPHALAIKVGARCDHLVEPAKENKLRAFAVMAQENGGQGRSQRQSVEGRNRYGKSDGQCELAEKDSRRAGEE